MCEPYRTNLDMVVDSSVKYRRIRELQEKVREDRDKCAKGQLVMNYWYESLRLRGTRPQIGRLPTVIQQYLEELGITQCKRVKLGERDCIIEVLSAKGERPVLFGKPIFYCQAPVVIPAHLVAA
jgi:hypothetical protein